MNITAIKKYRFFLLVGALLAAGFHACKKEDIDIQHFVENHIKGKWPHKLSIAITLKNGVEISNDTTYYGIDRLGIVIPVDTVEYLSAIKCVKNNDTIPYSIDKTGDYIQYGSDADPDTWKILYLRTKSIILTQEKTEKQGADTYLYYKEERLIKR